MINNFVIFQLILYQNQVLSMSTVTDQMLEEMVQAIVQEVDPEKIILFGSQVTGTVHQDSDVDLLIIEKEPFGKHRSRWKELSRIRKTISRFRISKDILLYSTEEETYWGNAHGHILNMSMNEGKVVYER